MAAGAVDFGSLFAAMPVPYLVISPQMTVLAANAAYLALVNRTAADLVGHDMFAAFPENPADPHADGAANMRASLQRVLATGRPDKMAVQQHDVATQAGGDVFQPRYWKVVNTPVLDASGAVIHILHSNEEVTRTQMQGGGLRDVLANLTDTIRDLKTADEIGYAAAEILGEALGTSRVGYGTIDEASDTLLVVRDWCA